MARLGAFVLGTPDPAALAAFYRELLGWMTVEAATRRSSACVNPSASGPG